jgi:hypothetical protein
MLGGQWKVQILGGPGKVLMIGGPGKVLMIGGQWKVPMFGGQWKEKEKHLFHLFSLPPQQILLKFFFSIDIKVLLYHGFRPLLMPFFLFL